MRRSGSSLDVTNTRWHCVLRALTSEPYLTFLDMSGIKKV